MGYRGPTNEAPLDRLDIGEKPADTETVEVIEARSFTQRGQPVYYLCDPAVFDFLAGPPPKETIHLSVTAGANAPRPVLPEPEGRRRPMTRTDLEAWFEEARHTLRNDRLPPEFYQVRGSGGAWPDIVLSRSEVAGAERDRRELAQREGRGQTDRAEMPRSVPSAAEIDRLRACLGWAIELPPGGLRKVVMLRLCNRSFTAIGEEFGVSHTAVRKRYRKALDHIWQGVSGRGTKS